MHYDAYNYIADIKYVVDGKLSVRNQFVSIIFITFHAALEWDKFSFLAHSMGINYYLFV